MELLDKEIGINKINVATELAIEENRKKIEKTDKELVPEEYHEYLDIDAIIMLLPAEITQIAPIYKGYKIDRTS